METNTAVETFNNEEYEFKYSFINLPWDDRSKWSKIGIVTLLFGIFLATMSLVAINFVIHYKNFKHGSYNTEMDCNLARVEDYRYVARIYSISSHEIICVGAIVSYISVLASEVCSQTGPIRLHVGNPIDPKCKKGFSIDLIESVPHEGALTKNLILLTTYENMAGCISVIPIGFRDDYTKQGYIVGRPLRGIRSLSFQHASIVRGNDFANIGLSNNNTNVIYVKDLSECPVRIGDLLVLGKYLMGIAFTSVYHGDHKKVATFANLSIIRQELFESGVFAD